MATQSFRNDPESLNGPSGDESALSPIRILVVEDDLDTAALIRHLLESEGYDVVELNSGADALELINAVERGADTPFDVALLDIMMPQITGYDVCQEIRRTERLGYIPIIMVTALSSTEDLVRGLDLGADDYLVKPFDYRDLLARVRAALRVRGLDRAMRRRNWQLAVLNSLNDAIGGSLDRDEVLEAGLAHVSRYLAVDYVVAFLRDRHAGDLERVYVHDGEDWLVERIAHPSGPVNDSDGANWQRRDAYKLALDVVVSGQRRWQTEAGGWPTQPDAGQDWRACVPLKRGSTDGPGQVQLPTGSVASTGAVSVAARRPVLGVLLVGASAARPMIDLDLLTAVGNQIGQALENCRFYQQARNRSEELVALFDSISDPIYVVDDEYRITAPNVALIRRLVEQRSGSSTERTRVLESIVGRTCYQTLYGRPSPCEGCQMEAALHSGKHLQWAERRRRPDGGREEWEISAYPIRGHRDEPSQVIILGRDITERRMLEASLGQSEKLAALGQLAAGLAHEINNPLTAIVANVQLLLRNSEPDDLEYESLALIKQASDRATRVVRNLLDFARQEQYEFQATDINASLSAALELLSHQFRIAEVDVSAHLAPDLPAALVSQDHLQGVWLNLLLNARDAVTQRKKVDVPSCVWVSSTLRDDGFLAVTIRDNGVGIPPDQLNHIFEPFFTTKDPGKGTGLGLSTSFRVVKQHGGDIQVDSDVDEGTTFSVLLPPMEQNVGSGAR
jgi:two-component system NtrC family sensor kinase